MSDIPAQSSGTDEEQPNCPQFPTAANEPKGTGEKDADSESELTTSQPKNTMASLLKQAESAALKILSDVINEDEATTTYCCGGRVATSLNNKVAWEAPEVLGSSSIPRPSKLDLNSYTFRFDDPSKKGISRQLLFPLKADNLEEAWPYFLEAFQGSGGLGILSPKQFSFDFDPCRSGLLDVVAQIFLAGFKGDILKNRIEHRGVRASAPMLLVSLASRHSRNPTHSESLQIVPASEEKVQVSFNNTKSPSDTLGKLFVRLPTPHKGISTSQEDYPALLTRKGGKWQVTQATSESTIFNWDNVKNANATLQWAAIRKSCDVTIHPIQDGPQMVLLYNLVVSERVGGLLLSTTSPSKAPFTNPSYHALYDSFKNLLETPGFMKEGKFASYTSHPHL